MKTNIILSNKKKEMKGHDDKVFLVIGGAGIALALALYFDAQQTPPDEIKEIELGRMKRRPQRDHRRLATVETKETDNIALFRAAEKEKRIKEIEKYNKQQELYTGNGDAASKSLYFARQAYKQARTPVAPIPPIAPVELNGEEEEEFVKLMSELEDEEKEKESNPKEDPIPPLEPIKPREVPASRKVIIPKDIWDRRDPPRFKPENHS